MRYTSYAVLGILFLLSACAKEKLEVTIPSQQPIFKVNLLKDGDSLLIEAGRNDFYLFTDNIISTAGDVFSPYSEFAKLDQCTVDCLEAFSIQIRNIPTDEVDTYFSDENLNPGNFDLKADQDASGSVLIKYTGTDGVVYLSSLGPQMDTDYFTVQKIEPYIKNEKGQQTKLLHVLLQCHLYDENGGIMTLGPGEVVFAAAIP